MNGLIVLVLASGAVQAAEQKVHRDLPYAGTTHRLQTLDVYAPSGGSHHPVLVWIHGGGWRQGDKSNVQHKPQAFIQHGFVFVSVNYRLAPEVSLKEMAGDVAKAIRWVHDHIADYGGDPRAIYVAGHSAGAHLAALVCTDERYLSREKLSLELIKGCIPVDTAVYDVGQQIKESGPLRAQLYVTVFGEDPNLHREFSPIHHVAKAKGIPPFLILHVADRPDSTAQSRSFGAALQAASVYAKVVACKGQNPCHHQPRSWLGRRLPYPGNVPIPHGDARHKEHVGGVVRAR
ncbi:MAG: hypothetical protein KatS3mg110_0499 [Pirellulaceae bacterium]|nr:MAG: hypothetical protein KatS3mg110_0499 [Pirellulaceae bacterium]